MANDKDSMNNNNEKKASQVNKNSTMINVHNNNNSINDAQLINEIDDLINQEHCFVIETLNINKKDGSIQDHITPSDFDYVIVAVQPRNLSKLLTHYNQKHNQIYDLLHLSSFNQNASIIVVNLVCINAPKDALSKISYKKYDNKMADIMNDNNENAEYHYNYQSNILTGIIYYCSIFPEISQQNRTFLIMVVMQN